MTYQGSWLSVGPTIVSAVQPGDILVGIFTARQYVIREGASTFDPRDAVAPPGWTLVDWWVAVPGGDPRRLVGVRLVYARIADASTAGSRFEIRSAVPYYERDQDPGSFAFDTNNAVGNASEGLGAGETAAHYWRGERGIAALDRARNLVPAHAVAVPAGRSRAGGGSVMQWGAWSSDGGFVVWKSGDNATRDAGNPARTPSNPILAGEGSASELFCWVHIGSLAYAHQGTVTTHALTLSTVNVPMPPLLSSPAGALLDIERDGLTLEWLYRPALAGAQVGWVLSMTRGVDAPMYWDASARSWAGAPVRNPGAFASVDLPASTFAGGTGLEHRFTVAAYAASGELSLDSEPVTVTGTHAPTVFGDFVGVDAARSLASLRPQLSISGAPADGLTLDEWSAALVDVDAGRELAASTGAFSQTASVIWAPGVDVTNGTRLSAVLRVRQSGGAWSAPLTVTATADVDAPGAPTVEAAPGTHPESGAPAVRVSVVFPHESDGYAWTASPTTLRVQRLDAGEWVDAALISLPLGVTSAALEDYAAPAGLVSYRARGEAQTVDGSPLVGSWGLSEPITLDVEGGWIIDPRRPAAAVRVGLVEQESRSRDLRAVRMAALGRADEIVASRVALMDSGELTVRVDNPAQHGALMDLLASGAVLRVTFPPERDAFSELWQTGENLWVRVVGEMDTQRIARGAHAVRHVVFSWVGQYPPIARSEA